MSTSTDAFVSTIEMVWMLFLSFRVFSLFWPSFWALTASFSSAFGATTDGSSLLWTPVTPHSRFCGKLLLVIITTATTMSLSTPRSNNLPGRTTRITTGAGHRMSECPRHLFLPCPRNRNSVSRLSCRPNLCSQQLPSLRGSTTLRNNLIIQLFYWRFNDITLHFLLNGVKPPKHFCDSRKKT